MLLRDRLIKTGHFCFKYRSYQFPVFILILLLEHNHLRGLKENMYYDVSCILVTFCGILVRALTVGFVHEKTSGRNTKAQNAYELNTTGAYSVVRNPLYVGNYLVLLGMSLLPMDPWVAVLNSAAYFLIYFPIIMTEEAYLLEKFGEQYADYASRVNCVIPSFGNFTRPVRSFSRNIFLKREHDTWLTAAVGLVGVQMIRDYFAGLSVFNAGWLALLGAVFVTWAVLKYMKKTGRLKLVAV